MKLFHFFVAAFLLTNILHCRSQPNQRANETSQVSNGYTYRKASQDGIGKFYMDREISHVMGAGGSAWLDRAERVSEEAPMTAIAKMPIEPGSVVADIGAGTGYYTFRIAPKLTAGKIYAVELQKEMLSMLKQRKNANNTQNVEIISGTNQSVNLPDNSIDIAFMVDVYHELEYPQEMLTAIKESLKPEGKILLIEYRGEDPEVAIKPLHKMTVKQVEKELKANGFKLVENGQFMKIQHFLVFEKAD